MVDDIAVQEFVDAISTPPQNTITTYSGVVSRIDNQGVVWVRLAGANNETPTASTSAEVEIGDEVTVEWRNYKLFIGGNYSNPSAGVIRVDAVQQAAQVANTAAQNAVADAGIARQAAEQAQADAADANTAAQNAQTSADSANASAASAFSSANRALVQLSTVENVVGTLDWISTHGTYVLSEDLTDSGQMYFSLTGEAVSNPTKFELSQGQYYELINDVYVLSTDTDIDQTKTYYKVTAVVQPIPQGGSPSELGYYELGSIEESVQTYIASHLALTNEGLTIQQDDSQYRMLLSSDGLSIIGQNGTVASYGTETVVGNRNGFHIEISGTEVGFYQNATSRVAYINGDQLYITKSVVLQQMDLGTPVVQGGLGQWTWKVHPNGETPSRNNLNLKWIG